MAGIKIDFAADVGKFIGGTKDVEKALDGVADSLDDLTREAARAGDEMGDGIQDGARKAERAVDGLGKKAGDSLEKAGDEAKDAGKKIGNEIEDGTEKAEDAGKKLERKFKDVFDDVKDDARKAGDEVGDETKRGFGRAEVAAEGFKDEAQQNFAETASSFDGSMDSIADMAQSTLGGLATAIPGAGVALAGLGAAAGAFYAQWQESSEKTQERISEMYQDMAESGNRFLSEGFINEKISEWIADVDPGRLAQHEAAAADLGIEMGTAVRAMNGDAAAAQEVLAQAAAYLETAQGSAKVDVQGMVDAINAQGSAAGSAAAKADLLAASTQATGEAAREYDAAVAELPASVQEASEAIAGNVESMGSQAAAADANNAVLAGLADELAGVRDAAVDAGVSGDELTAVESGLAGQFYDTARAAGHSSSEAEALARRYGLIPRTVRTDVVQTGMATALSQALALEAAIKRIPARKVVTFEGRTIGTVSVIGFTPGSGQPIYGRAAP